MEANEELRGLKAQACEKLRELVEACKQAEMLLSEFRIGLVNATSNIDKKLEDAAAKKKWAVEYIQQIAKASITSEEDMS